jgi:hypothetical protein
MDKRKGAAETNEAINSKKSDFCGVKLRSKELDTYIQNVPNSRNEHLRCDGVTIEQGFIMFDLGHLLFIHLQPVHFHLQEFFHLFQISIFVPLFPSFSIASFYLSYMYGKVNKRR